MCDTLNNTSFEQCSNKRKRKTSDEQYELYLEEMEIDYVFRSGTINPTLGENYLANKWNSLVDKLNCTSNGPQLSLEEWKRRFKDWKNSTRSKFRKIQDSRNATGGGPQSSLKLTDIEERGLSVWERVTVAGLVGIEEGGLPQATEEMPADATDSVPYIEYEVLNAEIEERIKETENDVLVTNINASENVSGSKKKYSRRTRPSPLNEVAAKLLDLCNNSELMNRSVLSAIENFTTTYKANSN